ncbi:MAG: PA2169 family four-helix-bundle protein [Porphyrobacter sp. IPPAS B-1204]|nr:MAG: PA2169 family four-helix-bundle protein [Porphyrobacter sp. IPPAS B-1204]
MNSTSHDISTLNNLLATTFDSVDGYAEAAKNSDGDRFTALFKARMLEREAVITSLRSEVTRLGGNPEDDGTMMGGAHRMFLNLKSVVTGRDDAAIIAEVEQGEDHIKAMFEEAMADTELSPQVMHTIRECFASIKQGHDQMRDLKHSMT